MCWNLIIPFYRWKTKAQNGKGFARVTQWIGGYGWIWALGCWNPILYLFNHIRVLKYMVHRQPALKLLVYILNGQVLGLTHRHRHLVTVPVYTYSRVQNTWMSMCWHTDVTIVMIFFYTPGDGLGEGRGGCQPPTIHSPWKCLQIALFFVTECLCAHP